MAGPLAPLPAVAGHHAAERWDLDRLIQDSMRRARPPAPGLAAVQLNPLWLPAAPGGASAQLPRCWRCAEALLLQLP